MDEHKDNNQTQNILNFFGVKNSKEYFSELSTVERRWLKQKLENELGKNLISATSAIESATKAANEALRPTQGAIQSLITTQDELNKSYLPWANMKKDLHSNKLMSSQIKSTMGSAWKALNPVQPQAEKIKTPDLIFGTTMKELGNAYYENAQLPDVSATLKLDRSLLMLPQVKRDLVPEKLNDTSESLNKLAVTLERHFTEDKLVVNEQTKLLETLAKTADIQINVHKTQLAEIRKSSQHSTKLSYCNIGLVVVTLMLTVYIQWFSKKEPVQISQPLTVHLSESQLAPISEKMNALQKEVEFLRKKRSEVLNSKSK